jgi:cell division protein FtsB
MTPTSSLGRLLLWLAAGVFLVLQFKLWFGEGGIVDVHRIKQSVAAQQAENLILRQRNAVLEAEVNDLKNGQAAIEERARLDLGMIKDDETFYLVTGKALAGSITADNATPKPATPAHVSGQKALATKAVVTPPSDLKPVTVAPLTPSSPIPSGQP